ncbi:MAG: hypothetical protein HYY78_04030 [Betaproteobacteria bacterium]|nr:hypothetical protein [Betaproteobacteria bacterium]
MKGDTKTGFSRLLLWSLLTFVLAACGRAERWVDEALLHDGRVIDVHRSVIFNFGSGDLSQALTRWPNQFTLAAVNPHTGRRVEWSGERNIHHCSISSTGCRTWW